MKKAALVGLMLMVGLLVFSGCSADVLDQPPLEFEVKVVVDDSSEIAGHTCPYVEYVDSFGAVEDKSIGLVE